jgi:hypothetical protein
MIDSVSITNCGGVGAKGFTYQSATITHYTFTDFQKPKNPSDFKTVTIGIHEVNMQQIAIDNEFKSLIPSLTDDERAQLEANLIAEGCRDALVCWRQGDTLTLIDGHNRYELCAKHALPYSIVERSFDSREDAIIWIVNNQLARRNISDYTKVKLALRMKDAIAAKAREKQRGGQGGVLLRQNSDEAIRTDAAVADVADVSRDTVRKVEEIEKEAPEPIKKKAAAGELSINRASNLTKALKGAPELVKTIVAAYDVDDAETVNILKRLAKNKSETLGEIAATGYIQIGDEHEAVHISAGALKAQQALDERAKIHKQEALDAKRGEIETAAFAVDMAKSETSKREFKRGDIVRVGKHILVCDDNRSERVHALLKAEGKAALAFCDPPYNASAADYDDGTFVWDQDFLMERADVVAVTPGISSIHTFMRLTEMPYRWSVSVHISNGMTRSPLGFGNWIYTAVFSHLESLHRNAQDATTIAISSSDSDPLVAKRQKPPRYLAWLFQLLTKRGDLIVDAFGGSGAAVIVGHELERRVISIEIDPEVFTAMVVRIENAVENDAELMEAA